MNLWLISYKIIKIFEYFLFNNFLLINFCDSILESKWVAPSVYVSIEEQEAKKKREEEDEEKEAEKKARVVCNTI